MCINTVENKDYLNSYTSHMSNDSEETNLISKDSESTIAENNVEKTGLKIKKNYCYVCKVQCTAPRNYIEHQKGKKHLKNTILLQSNKKPSQEKKSKKNKKPVKTKTTKKQSKNFIKIPVTPTKSLDIDSKNSFEEKQKNINSDSIDKLDNVTMSNFNNSAQNNQYGYNNRNYGSQNYSSYQNYRHYPNNYRHDKFHYDGRPYYDYPRWNSQFSNANNLQRSEFRHRNQYYTEPVPPGDAFFSENRYTSFQSYGNNCESYVNSSDVSNYDTKSLEAAKRIPFWSNLSSSKSISKPTRKYYSDDSVPSSETLNEKPSNQEIVDTNRSSNTTEDGASTSKVLPSISQMICSKYKVNNRMRSRSLSSSEIEKNVKDKNEAKIDSDATEEERIKEWTNSLLETSHNQISRLINPSNYKDKAAVNHLITKFSKSKRKEILISLRSNSLDSTENNDEDVTTEGSSKLDASDNSVSNEIEHVVDTDKSTVLELPDVSTPEVRKNKKKSKNSDCYKDEISENIFHTTTMKPPRKQTSKKSRKSVKKIKNSSDLSSKSRKEKCSSSAFSDLSSESSKSNSSSTCRNLSSESRKEKNSSSTCRDLSPESRTEKNSNSTCSDLPSELRREKISSSTCGDLSSELRREIISSSTCSDLSSESRKENNAFIYKGKEKYVKRKSSDDGVIIGKKQKTGTMESFEITSNNKAAELQEDFHEDATSSENLNFRDSMQPSCQVSSNLLSELKVEVMEHCELNETVSSTTTSSENVQDENLPFSSEISVETLIQLFATGSVKVKEEFNDPVMEAIKDISPEELVSACSNQFLNESETASKTTFEKNTASRDRISKDKSGPGISEKPSEINTECVNPVIMSSAVINENMTPTSIPEKSDTFLPNASTSEKSENQICLSSNNDKNSNDSLSDVRKLDALNQARPEFPSYLNKLIKELQDIATREETVKQNLNDAKSKISEYTSLLEEWKNKKRELQEHEEILRKQRNDIIKSLQGAVKLGPDDSNEEPASSVPEERTLFDQPLIAEERNEPECTGITVSPAKSQTSSSTPSLSFNYQEKKKKSNELSEASESDDITILPSPTKPKPPEIIICDDEETSPVTGGSRSNIRSSRNEMMSNVRTDKRPAFYDFKTMSAHPTVINSLVVFEDFLYTCSNDSTAKRFSLKDSSLTVTYLHAAKNVTEIVVEKVQNEALVFTSCSTRVISLFIASSGTKIKSFFPPCAVMSICKGWGKFYSGLANGSVNVYNWKYEEIEIVKTEQQPASRIATAYQGRLHVLVILSSEGNISIRDAETGLLIRYIKIYIKHPSWMCLHRDLVYLSSADKSLIILDVMSGREEKRLYMSSHATGLAVYDDYIFTIAYTGIINCFNKDNSSDKKLFYGAGKNALTCVHVYRDLVFTGNRKGDVSVFHFDPDSTAVCEFAKCDMIYGLKEDLEYHVEKDHLSKKKMLLRCNWKGCDFTFPRNADNVDKMNHIKVHIHEILL